MKTKHLIPVFLLLAIGTFSSCDLFDKVDDVSFDVTLPVDFTISDVTVNPSGKTYTDSRLLDASSDPEVAKYASKIKEFKVNRITYTISPGADPSTVTLTNGFLKANGKNLIEAASVSLSNTTETDFNTNTAGLNELASLLLADKKETIEMTGFLSKTPVVFTVKLKFYVTITADVL
jgi:hypothetical protein